MQAYGREFSELYNAKWSDYSKRIAPAILDFYESCSVTGNSRSILDLCCGAGHLTACLLAKGYSVVGIDLSEHMLSWARENARSYIDSGLARFIQADAADFALDDHFGLVVSTYDSLNHLADRETLAGCFRCVHQVCEGYFIFDLNTRRGLDRWNVTGIDEDDGGLVVIRRGSYDGHSARAQMKFTVFRIMPDGSYRRYDETVYNTVFETGWVEKALHEAGFSHVHFARADDLSAPLADPEREGRVFVVART